MDNRFYNIEKKKKLGEWVLVQGTGSTEYDLGLYYVSGMVNELLQTYYYAKINLSKRLPQEIYEVKRENYELYFIYNVFCLNIDINLYKLIDKNKKAWSLNKLFSVIREYGWTEEGEIKNGIDVFTTEIKQFKDARHERHAHTSMKNKPNVLHANARLESYRNIIKEAMELVDKFVDGKIPYLLYFGEPEEYDLRELINSG